MASPLSSKASGPGAQPSTLNIAENSGPGGKGYGNADTRTNPLIIPPHLRGKAPGTAAAAAAAEETARKAAEEKAAKAAEEARKAAEAAEKEAEEKLIKIYITDRNILSTEKEKIKFKRKLQDYALDKASKQYRYYYSNSNTFGALISKIKDEILRNKYLTDLVSKVKREIAAEEAAARKKAEEEARKAAKAGKESGFLSRLFSSKPNGDETGISQNSYSETSSKQRNILKQVGERAGAIPRVNKGSLTGSTRVAANAARSYKTPIEAQREKDRTFFVGFPTSVAKSQTVPAAAAPAPTPTAPTNNKNKNNATRKNMRKEALLAAKKAFNSFKSVDLIKGTVDEIKNIVKARTPSSGVAAEGKAGAANAGVAKTDEVKGNANANKKERLKQIDLNITNIFSTKSKIFNNKNKLEGYLKELKDLKNNIQDHDTQTQIDHLISTLEYQINKATTAPAASTAAVVAAPTTTSTTPTTTVSSGGKRRRSPLSRKSRRGASRKPLSRRRTRRNRRSH
jgi:hypothetical protein